MAEALLQIAIAVVGIKCGHPQRIGDRGQVVHRIPSTSCFTPEGIGARQEVAKAIVSSSADMSIRISDRGNRSHSWIIGEAPCSRRSRAKSAGQSNSLVERVVLLFRDIVFWIGDDGSAGGIREGGFAPELIRLADYTIAGIVGIRDHTLSRIGSR